MYKVERETNYEGIIINSNLYLQFFYYIKNIKLTLLLI